MNPTLTCYSGVGTVTGANFLLSYNNTNILVDCGITQGVEDSYERNRAPFAYDPKEMDMLFATHAHMDHIGRIPRLVKEGFRGTIYSTAVTRELAELMFDDALGVMGFRKREKGEEPMYEEKDVAQTFSQWKVLEYGVEEKLNEGITVVLKEAGHILGSSLVEFMVGEKKVLFTGDLGNNASALLRSTEGIQDIDYLLMDSVYGDRNHEDIGDAREKFKDIVVETANKNGVVMIPAFSLERTQELLFLLNNLVETKSMPSVPVYVDSPLAIKVTGVYEKNTKYMNTPVQEQIASGDKIFDFPQLEFTHTSRDSREINDSANPKIVIAGSGMSTGGRILHHEKRYLPDPHSTLLLVGHQAVGTLGRELEEGAKEVEIDGDMIPVRARIEKIDGFSAHKDRDGLLEFVEQTAPSLKKVFVSMGEPKSSLALAQRIKDYLGVEAQYPEVGKVYELK